MCVGSLFGGPPKAPPAPKMAQPAPQVKAAAPPPEMISPEKIKEEVGDEEKISTKKKKALEIQKTKEGVKQLGAVDPASLPKTPSGGINI